MKPVAFLFFYLVFISITQALSQQYTYSPTPDSESEYINTPVAKVFAEISFLSEETGNSHRDQFTLPNSSASCKFAGIYEIILPKNENVQSDSGTCYTGYSDLPPPGVG